MFVSGLDAMYKTILGKDIQNIQVIFCHKITKHAHFHSLARHKWHNTWQINMILLCDTKNMVVCMATLIAFQNGLQINLTKWMLFVVPLPLVTFLAQTYITLAIKLICTNIKPIKLDVTFFDWFQQTIFFKQWNDSPHTWLN